jgi:hypothetical protein
MRLRRQISSDDNFPSLRDIRDACRRIQSDWSDSERRTRAGLPRHDLWTPPMIRSNQLGGDMEVESEA